MECLHLRRGMKGCYLFLFVGYASNRVGPQWATSAFSLEPTTNPPLLDVPTYSFATLGADGRTNMNILTYATPVSVRPERIWTLGLYKETLTYTNFRERGYGILQMLCQSHAQLVPLLGGSSGRDVDKQSVCERLGFPWHKLPSGGDLEQMYPLILQGCIHYLKLSLVQEMYDAGSHAVAICKTESMWTSAPTDTTTSTSALACDSLEYLSTGQLREMGIITEQGRVAESFLL